MKTITYESGADMPFKPTAIVNYKLKSKSSVAKNATNNKYTTRECG